MPGSFRVTRRVKKRIGFDVLQIVGSTTMPGAMSGSSYTSTLSAQGGSSPYTFTAINSLPSGLSMGTDGMLTGTPDAAATSTFAIQVQDALNSTARKNFVLTVAPSTQLQITDSTRLTSAIVDSTYSHTFASTGGTAPYSSYSAVNILPSGFSLSSSGGLTGTLTSSGLSSFTVQVKDDAGSTASKQFSIVALTNDAHAYFDGLLARGDFYKALSMRPISSVVSTGGGYSTGVSSNGTANPYFANQLALSSAGGYRAGSSQTYVNVPALSYNPASDTHVQAQDAMKGRLPAFDILTANPMSMNLSVSSNSSFVTVTAPQDSSFAFVNNATFRIDNEIIKLESAVGWDPALPGVNTPRRQTSSNVWELRCLRGQYGTAASTHAAGVDFPVTVNSLPNSMQLRFPLNTIDGHAYFITWDVFYCDDWLGNADNQGNKFFQLSDYNDSIWLETKMDYLGTPSESYWPVCDGFSTTTHASDFGVRSYNTVNDGSTTWSTATANMLGPGTTRELPLSPPVGTFCVPTGKWVRLFWYIDQRVNDWDPVTFWAADESREAVKVLDAIKVSVRPGSGVYANMIRKWWIEWNDSSVQHMRGTNNPFRDFTVYFRNLAVLIDPPTGELTSTGLLQKPVG